ncbi:dTMP kinase [Nocardiopsis sp. RSe5-2]|uniref:Thymidylate kinase n=1 Tax=Nocardiopsis endophytica TaxID=3018445 RepID=A0ABT4UDL2_9ACTN|nr:dTMP kinase [Nocardiopsis endophytica]MDA2815053.1 dTMP kinase [Nocardiopsis endophytica]
MSRSAPLGAPGEARSVLANPPFRRLWISLSLSSLGDWLSLLALMSLATILTMDASPVVQYFAVSGVVLLKIAPWLLLSPFAGVVADRFDRRLTMVAADVLRGLLYVSIPVVGRLDWLLVANFLAECVAIFWTPAKDASVPNLVPRKKLEQANQLTLLTAYGTAPVAAGLFALLASLSTVLGMLFPAMATPEADIALYINGLTFFIAAAVVWTLPLPGRPERAAPAAPAGADDDRTEEVPLPPQEADPNELTAPIGQAATLEVPAVPSEQERKAAERAEAKARRQEAAAERRAARASGDGQANPLRTIWEGWRFAGSTPLVRGLMLGMLGAFAAGGAVVGVGRVFVDKLEAGNAGFGVLFGALFAGMALGMLAGPRTLREFSRRRLFGLALGTAGVALFFTGLVPNMVLAAVLTAVVGAGAGLAWVIGLTLMGQEVQDEVRGRTFAFLHAAGRLVLLGAVALSPLLAAAIGDHTLSVRDLTYDFLGTGAVLMVAAVLAVVVAVVSYRQMNADAGDVPLMTELLAALRGVPVRTEAADGEDTALPGTFVVLEGGEGAGKSTQVQQLSVWLREEGFEVVTTREPGATKLGMRLRALLLDKEQTGMSPRAEALLYASDRADHVHQVILPALRRGAIVISDRYVDSTLAYQGAGRELPSEEIARVNDWATGGLVPRLTVLLDLPAEDGLSRLGGGTDRIEAESQDFHERVRRGFRELADAAPERYLVVDARESQERVTREIQRRLRPLLPDPVPSDSEAITGMMPVVGDPDGDD